MIVTDPTDRDDLITLRERAKAQLRDSGADLTQPTALVLSGGGGKGAYEAGCLLALWDCGLENFQAVAGASVGALNAALFKRLLVDRDRAAVLRVWSNLSFGRVVAGSPWTIIKLLLYIPICIAALQSPAKATFSEHRGNLGIEMERFRDWVSQFVAAFLLMVLPVCVGALGLVSIAMALGTALRRSGLSQGVSNLILVTCTLAVPLLARLASRRLGLARRAPLK